VCPVRYEVGFVSHRRENLKSQVEMYCTFYNLHIQEGDLRDLSQQTQQAILLQ
jgi:hypothetical protein